MPYIKQDNRIILDRYINDLSEAISDKHSNEDIVKVMGDLNYTITRLCAKLIGKDVSYTKIGIITGVLENVKQEFYRRIAVPYEENKVVENGDVKEFEEINFWKSST
jgi:hypothetical protein